MWVNFSLILHLGSKSACRLTTICYNVIVKLEKGAGNSETCFNHVSIVVWHKYDSLPMFVFTAVGYSGCRRWHCAMNSNFVAVREKMCGFCESSFVQCCKSCSWMVPWDLLCLTAIRLLANLPAINFRNWWQNCKCAFISWSLGCYKKFIICEICSDCTRCTVYSCQIWVKIKCFLCWPT